VQVDCKPRRTRARPRSRLRRSASASLQPRSEQLHSPRRGLARVRTARRFSSAILALRCARSGLLRSV